MMKPIHPRLWLSLGSGFALLVVAQVALGLFAPPTDSVGAFSDAPLAGAPEATINTVLALDVVVGVLLAMGVLQVYRFAARKSIQPGRKRKRR